MSHGKHAVRPYLIVFGALMVLTVVTVALSYVHMPPLPAIALGLIVATVKAGLVASVFMHLRGEKGLIYFFLGLTGLFLLFLFVLPAFDFNDLTAQGMTQRVDVVAEKPGGGEH